MDSSAWIGILKLFTENPDIICHKLLGNNGKPLRLFNKNGLPVTDYSGDLLLNISGKNLIQLNRDKTNLEDLRGFPLTDHLGHSSSDYQFNPEGTPKLDFLLKLLLDKRYQPRLLFDVQGAPLTDKQGRPLSNSSGECLLILDDSGEPVSDLIGRQIIDYSYLDGYNNTKVILIEKKSGLPLQLYDESKRPLTTSDGYCLLDIMGRPLLIFDNQNNAVTTTYGSELYDCKNHSKSNPLYNPCTKVFTKQWFPPVLDENGNILLIFNQSGLPLTDSFGTPLVDSDGLPLFKYDGQRKVIATHGFDTIQILACSYSPVKFRSILNNAGSPVRIYNFQGKPLTNWLGEPLSHADGSILLKFDFQGNPKCDFRQLPIYDEFGIPILDCPNMTFDELPVNESVPFLIETDESKNAIRLYDGSGMPVTDHRGFYLTNASRNPMVTTNLKQNIMCDYNGQILYTECGLPLINSLSEPILSPKGKICSLFNSEGYPLTCKNGYSLKLMNGDYTIKIDTIGRIISDYNGKPLYDTNNISMRFYIKFNATKTNNHSKKERQNHYALLKNTKQFYNKSCNTLSKETAKKLNDSGKPPIRVGLKYSNSINTVDSCLTYHNDKNVNISDKYTAPSNKSRPNIDKLILSGKNKPRNKEKGQINKKIPEESVRFNGEFLLNNKFKIFNYDSIPLVDQFGDILVTSFGEPVVKFDDNGKVISDFQDRDVYDEDGLPLTKVTGYWKDKKGNPLRIFNRYGFPLTDTRGKSLHDIYGHSLLGRDEFGRPLLDCNNNIVYDAHGISSNDYTFSLAKQPDNDQLCPLLDSSEMPVRIFDSKGQPLNDVNGVTLVNDKGVNLIAFSNLGLDSIEDFSGNTVYDQHKIPMGQMKNRAMKTMLGSPFRLFDINGRPLTDFSGFPLKCANGECLIEFDLFGRPYMHYCGKGLYDSEGQILGSSQFQPEAPQLAPKKQLKHFDDSPLRVYDRNGKPLTDQFGNILVNCKGEDMVFIESDIPICDIDGYSLFDEQGNDIIIEFNSFVLLVYK